MIPGSIMNRVCPVLCSKGLLVTRFLFSGGDLLTLYTRSDGCYILLNVLLRGLPCEWWCGWHVSTGWQCGLGPKEDLRRAESSDAGHGKI